MEILPLHFSCNSSSGTAPTSDTPHRGERYTDITAGNGYILHISSWYQYSILTHNFRYWTTIHATKMCLTSPMVTVNTFSSVTIILYWYKTLRQIWFTNIFLVFWNPFQIQITVKKCHEATSFRVTYEPTCPPVGPRPLLWRRNTWRLKQLALCSKSSRPTMPLGPRALSLRSNSVNLAPHSMMAWPRCFWNKISNFNNVIADWENNWNLMTFLLLGTEFLANCNYVTIVIMDNRILELLAKAKKEI